MSDTSHPAGIGHNSGGVSAEKLRSFVHRIERMNEEIKELQEDRKEIYAEAKSFGYDAATIRRIVRESAMDPHKRQEREELFDLYAAALGIFG